jgi:hypothetical protein
VCSTSWFDMRSASRVVRTVALQPATASCCKLASLLVSNFTIYDDESVDAWRQSPPWHSIPKGQAGAAWRPLAAACCCLLSYALALASERGLRLAIACRRPQTACTPRP